ncbi:MAG: hypothetical protein WC621_01220 [Patescibacteria group bacterium]
MKKVLVLIQNLLKDKLTIPKPVSLSLKYFDIEYPSGNDDPQSIYVVADKGTGAYLHQFKNTLTEEVIVVYDRALSGNLDEWFINTIKSTWPTVKVSIESAADIKSVVAQLDSENLQNEFNKEKDFTNNPENDRVLTSGDAQMRFDI